MDSFDVIIIGGGPAGMCAGLEAYASGASVAILERDCRLGGILNQCIHNGFGLHYFKEELTGPEYALRLSDKVNKSGIKVFLDTMVVDINKDKIVKAVNQDDGVFYLEGKSIVLAMGCRERTAGAIQLGGNRPSGVYTAGMAQKLCNINGLLTGKEIVVLGSGDIGLIMARRMTFEGAKVKAVVELMPYSSGLKRNITQCLDDFNIPLYLSHTITKVVGGDRVEKVFIAPVDEKLRPIFEKEWSVDCDCILLSVGLVPENDLVRDMDIEFSNITQGAVVDENRQTSASGIFACGNVLHVHDLVDNVSVEGEVAGRAASEYAKMSRENSESNIDKNILYKVSAKNGVRYALPHLISEGREKVKVYFRVDKVYKNAVLKVASGEKLLLSKRYLALAPGEMESVTIQKVEGDIFLEIEVANE